MIETTLTRRLWHLDRDKDVRVDQSFLQTDPRSMVLLGEAGMGKTTLLRQLDAVEGYAFCPARKLINSADPHDLWNAGETLVIDALDEVASNLDGDAVDLVLRKLGMLGHPRFILSCRVADWRSATAIQGILDFYADAPLELHIEALDRDDALAFLAATLGPDRAEQTLVHLEERGLSGLWANPQTLILVQQVAMAGGLPLSKGDLFDRATLLMAREHREEKAESPLAEMADEDVLTAVGAACATLILTGKGAVSRQTHAGDDEVLLRDISRLPGAARLTDTLGSRLFKAPAPDRFTYAHRALGEFLGARWLAATADTDRKRRRLLDLFDHQALVPASLRGLHAWLAWHSPTLAQSVIRRDPMGVVEYGDADRLSPAQAREMLQALDGLSKDNPRFRAWSEYRASGLVQPALLPVVTEMLTGPGVEFGLKMMILQALKGSALIPNLTSVLTNILRDPAQAFATRSEAGERLVDLGDTVDWPGLIDGLVGEETSSSVRLASELMTALGFEAFSDAQILEVALSILPQSERTIGVYYGLQRKIPDNRIDALLDGLADAAMALKDRRNHPGFDSLGELAYGLIARRLPLGPVEAGRLWRWMRPFGGSGSMRRASTAIAEAFAGDTALRRAVQKLVLLDAPGDHNVWQRFWRLNERSVGLNPSEDDIVTLLTALDSQDERWRDVVRLARHSPTEGQAVRAEAARFVVGRAEEAAWLEGLVNPPIPEWEVKENARRAARDRKREADWAKHREDFGKALPEIRSGHYGYVIDPAKAYWNLFQDIGEKADTGPARIAEWLGSEIAEACLEGFEAFLMTDPAKPNASEIAESFAEDRRWEAGYIISAALAERFRSGRGFDDLPDERLMAGLYELRHTRVDDHAGISDLEPAIEKVLRLRGIWEAVQRQHFEPQLRRGRRHIDGLYRFMRDDQDAPLATTLAIEWLAHYPDSNAETEGELIDHLLTSAQGREALVALLPERRARVQADAERCGMWNAVGLLLAFDTVCPALEGAGPIPDDLFWHLRARQAGRRDDRPALSLEVDQLAWFIRTFRTPFPATRRPEGATSGDRNAWDASDYMTGLIDRLGYIATSEAATALAELRAVNDGYANAIRGAAAEQRRNRAEASWTSPDLVTVAAAVTDAPPTTSAQLQVVVLEELRTVQAKIRGSNVDWYKDFYQGDAPRKEDECRDVVLKMLGTLPFQIQAAPEGHLADDKRADIIFTLKDLMVPIEVKGQWHPQLWTAADQQLDNLYGADWRAGCGIFLALWFGGGAPKPLKPPPAGVERPTSADDLRKALVAQSASAQGGRTEIVVLDLARPD